MRNVKAGVLWSVLFLAGGLLSGCATSNHTDTELNSYRVNQHLARDWRTHGDERQAEYFENRNREAFEDDQDDFDWVELTIDIIAELLDSGG